MAEIDYEVVSGWELLATLPAPIIDMTSIKDEYGNEVVWVTIEGEARYLILEGGRVEGPFKDDLPSGQAC